MSQQINDLFEEHFPIKMTPNIAKAIIRLVNVYETRDSHPLAFNTYMLGINPCVFKTQDRDDFFAIFNLENEDIVQPLMETTNDSLIFGSVASDIRKKVSELDSVNSSFKVTSDPFNLYISYVLHVLQVSNLSNSLKQEAMFKCVMYLQYKFFTSLVNYRFPFKPDEGIMTAMFEGLTNKFDIKVYGTWKKVMEVRARNLIDRSSIHYKTLTDYRDDKKVIYLISDIQSRTRNQINLITTEYMRTKSENDKIGSYSSTGTDLEGEKVIMDETSVSDTMINNVYGSSLSLSRWIVDNNVRMISGLFANLNTTLLRTALVTFSDISVKQNRSGDSNKIKEENGLIIYIGTETLIKNIIQKCFRYCIINKIDMSKPVSILRAIKDAFSSSRISDKDILALRASVAELVLELTTSRREPTLSALRIAFVLYVMTMTFKYLK